jgi:hypothetical protein
MTSQAEKRTRKTAGSELSGGVRKTNRLDDPQEVLHRISGLADRLESAISAVGASGNVRDLTGLLREARGLYEMCAKLSGLLSDRITVQIINSPVFNRFRERIENSVIDCPRCSVMYEQALRDAAEAAGGRSGSQAGS